jgi:aspartate-semialdehyde dehydrogenase
MVLPRQTKDPRRRLSGLSEVAMAVPVVVLGATGMVGQRMLAGLRRHPWFRVVGLAASERSVGRPYREACTWRLGGEDWAGYGDLPVEACEPASFGGRPGIAFSALDTAPARALERGFAAAGWHVVSNAGAHRMDDDVPLLVPEINAEHASLIDRQGTTGGLVTNPNCTAMPVVLTLAPILRAVGVEAVCVASWQAMSGAGYPGESAWDLADNVHPHGGNEEDKLSVEPQKILGTLRDGRIEPAPFPLSARCVRVAVTDGHLVSVQVRTRDPLSPADAIALLSGWDPGLDLPTAPRPLLVHRTERDRPQPRLDRDFGGGMGVTFGRVERCPVMGLKWFALAHNTLRGAAGAAILNAELLVRSGRVGDETSRGDT